MCDSTQIIPILFWAIATILSLFYGFKAVDIFFSAEGVKDFKDKEKWPRKFHEFWMNFAGSFAGWIGIWILYSTFDSQISFTLILLSILSFTGVVGKLPLALALVIRGLEKLYEKLK